MGQHHESGSNVELLGMGYLSAGWAQATQSRPAAGITPHRGIPGIGGIHYLAGFLIRIDDERRGNNYTSVSNRFLRKEYQQLIFTYIVVEYDRME